MRPLPRQRSAFEILLVVSFAVAILLGVTLGIALAATALDVALIVLIWGVPGALTNLNSLLPLMVGGALIGLLLHPMSRSYQRIWFR